MSFICSKYQIGFKKSTCDENHIMSAIWQIYLVWVSKSDICLFLSNCQYCVTVYTTCSVYYTAQKQQARSHGCKFTQKQQTTDKNDFSSLATKTYKTNRNIAVSRSSQDGPDHHSRNTRAWTSSRLSWKSATSRDYNWQKNSRCAKKNWKG